MKIVVLNGSPKGDVSVTMQYVHYIQKKFKNHELKIINIAQRINQLETNLKAFNETISEIADSDGVIFAFPLYVFTVHSNYQRFIELVFERDCTKVFKGKYTALLATSVHFYDHTAINHMNAICDDLDMNYVDYFSPHMSDLQNEEERKMLVTFAANFFKAIESKQCTFRNYEALKPSDFNYLPDKIDQKIDISSKKIVVVADSLENSNLKKMIDTFRNTFHQEVDLVVLNSLKITGGCLGCLKCGYDYTCAYAGKDDFIEFYNSKLKTADIIIFAGAIKQRYLSSEWKRFFDRSFFNTHTPSLVGKQVGFLISGPMTQLPNLRQVFEAYLQWQKSNLIGIVSDEAEDSSKIDAQIYSLAKQLLESSVSDYQRPITFLGVAGMKIFRDEIFGPIRFPFLADHKAYKALGVYDFPQKEFKTRVMNLVMSLMVKIPSIRKEIYSNQIKPSMIKSLQKIVTDENL